MKIETLVVKDCVDTFMEKAKKFTVLDVACLKICLVSFGMFIGSLFSQKAAKWVRPFVFLSFIATFAALIYRVFFEGDAD